MNDHRNPSLTDPSVTSEESQSTPTTERSNDMKQPRPRQIKTSHLRRSAIVYQRHESPVANPYGGSSMFQNSPLEVALGWGWPQERIEVIDDGTFSSSEIRLGFTRLMKQVRAGQVGIVLVSDLSRLTRSPLELGRFLELSRQHGTLLALNGVIWPRWPRLKRPSGGSWSCCALNG